MPIIMNLSSTVVLDQGKQKYMYSKISGWRLTSYKCVHVFYLTDSLTATCMQFLWLKMSENL